MQRLTDATRSGVYRAASADAILQVTRGSDLDVALIDGDIAKALDFPDWYGGNWDALEDSLGDLSWRKGSGHVLVFRSYPVGDELGVLIDVLSSTAEYWAGRGKPFFAVFVDPQKKLGLPELYRSA